MKSIGSFLLAVTFVQTATPANLAISTYLRDGFTPSAIASDAAGNVYLAGSAVTDPVSGASSAMIAKLDPKASQYLYLSYLDSAASDQVSSMAVDASGNTYIAGWTANPNFPNFAPGGIAGTLGTAPTSVQDTRGFVAKLNPDGIVLFSILIGGSISAETRGIALTPSGQILVSGIANAAGFPTTAGAINLGDDSNSWFLTELNAAANNVVFSARGIGGSSIVVDNIGNIYLAGSLPGTDYPTTPGAYQTTFVQGHVCSGLCQIGINGNLQHVTKVDPSGSKLIYSTGINDATGAAGSTTNTGLAVDSAGNAYVTGTLSGGTYPLTVKPPSTYSGFLTKLDPAGAKLLFSVPIGGAGVQVDSSGAVYAGGIVSSYDPVGLGVHIDPVAPPPVFNWIPQQCLPDNITAISEAYVVKVDPSSGDVVDSQWIDGSAPGATGIALAGGKIWMTGTTPGPDVPFTPGVLAPSNLGPGFLAGGFLLAVDFSKGPNKGPAIACVLDGGNLTHIGPVAGFQLLSIFGQGLGPTQGVAAPDGTDPSIAGVSITFDGNPAPLLYVSATQINVAVPLPRQSNSGISYPPSTVMELNIGGVTMTRQFPLTVSNPNLFATLTSDLVSCPGIEQIGFQPVALNADGSMNSCTNPAKPGSTVFFFIHGVGAEQPGLPLAQQLTSMEAFIGPCATPVTSASLINASVYQVGVTMPKSVLPCVLNYETANETGFSVTFSYNGIAVGPRTDPIPGGEVINFPPNQPMPMIVWVTE